MCVTRTRKRGVVIIKIEDRKPIQHHYSTKQARTRIINIAMANAHIYERRLTIEIYPH